MTTGELVLAALQSFDLKEEGQGKYRCNSPIHPGSNSHAFTITIHPDGEHGAWKYHAAKGDGIESGSLYELAELLNITPAKDNRAVDTHRAYKDKEDYPKAHGVTAAVLEAAGWEYTKHINRPCWRWKVGEAYRYRMLDNKDDNRFLWGDGYKPALYGLDRAIKIANASGYRAIILCNGEPSTVVAQHYGLPAFCQPGGERTLFPELLTEIQRKWSGEIWIAMDCDQKGRAAAEKLQAQITDSSLIDMGLTDKGDLSDFCRLHTASAWQDLEALADGRARGNAPRDSRQLARLAWQNFTKPISGRIILMPFKQFWRLGGFAKFLYPKKLTGFLAASGQGKTTFLECLTDRFCQEGESGIWNGREWDDTEYNSRRIHRLSGISTDDLMLNQLFVQEVDQGDIDGIHGKPLTPEQERAFELACNLIASWKGRVWYSQAHEYLEDTITEMSDLITSRRRNGEKIGYAVFDYAQNMVLRDTGSNKTGNYYEAVIQKVRNFSQNLALHSFIASQVTKDGADEVESDYIPVPGDAHYIRDFSFNLFFALKRCFEDDYNLPLRPNGKMQRKPSGRGIARCYKNSAGVPGDVNLNIDLSKGVWLDSGWTVQRLMLTGDD